MSNSFIWFVVSIIVLKIIAMLMRWEDIQNEKQVKKRLNKWVMGYFKKGEYPTTDEKFYLREGVSIIANGGKLESANVRYTYVSEFFPATSSFFHGAYSDTPYLFVVIPFFVGLILLFI